MNSKLSQIELEVAAQGKQHLLSLGEGAKEHSAVYTPPRLARFVVRCADKALTDVGLEGLRAVPVLDPACGVGAFAAAAVSLFPRAKVRCFDIDQGALDIAGVLFNEPVTFHCADVLSDDGAELFAIPFGPTLAVIGNPPWSNQGSTGLNELMADFRVDHDGEPLAERKIGALSDAYVRFWRLSAELIRRREQGGVVALVTNSSFLNGPVHRGMRASLLDWFSTLHVFDLGGSALVSKAHTERDENVFPVRPGTCVVVAARGPSTEPMRTTLRLVGSRQSKLDRLESISPGEPFTPRPPFFVFGKSVAPFPDTWVSLGDGMPFHQEGLQSNRDSLVIDKEESMLRQRLAMFAMGLRHPHLEVAQRKNAHYDPEDAAAELRSLGDMVPIIPIAYRPFDDRFCCIADKVCHRPRKQLINAMQGSTRALLTVRKDRGDAPWTHAATTKHVVDNSYFSSRSGCRTRAFPERTPTGQDNVARDLFRHWPSVPTALELISIALTVCCSTSYRRRYGGALRLDYPHLPTPPSASWMTQAIACGDQLATYFESPADLQGKEYRWIGHRMLPQPPEFRLAFEHAEDLVGPLCIQSA